MKVTAAVLKERTIKKDGVNVRRHDDDCDDDGYRGESTAGTGMTYNLAYCRDQVVASA